MKLIAKTLYGLEKVLTNELIGLGAENVQPVNRAVVFEGDQYLLYKANYCLRTAMSVLVQIAEFRIRSSDDLYKNSLRVNWKEYLDPEHTFSVIPVVNSPIFHHTGYAGLLLKDAIADWFREKAGKRPSVDTSDPDIVFNLHISNDLVTISLDSSVVPLYKRGYRKEQGSAPINEILAAGIILLSGWKAETSFLDPMCGSGTIPIEAALIASDIPAGRFRQFYGFQRWRDYKEEQFLQVRNESESKAHIPVIKISGSDISDNAVSMTRTNVESAGLSDIITISNNDFSDLKASDNKGVIIMNPPYGQRIKSADNDKLYSMIGSTLKHNFPGYQAWLITSDRDSLKQVGLKPAKKTALFNGSLECVLVKYELYQGSKKNK
ncbi:MAG: class I SAM-dependent RNA methyltransferase [Bacteroidia bacterium]|nr:class I SAM-dependent RNA methyltransferase [Bacteroidia bacterium]